MLQIESTRIQFQKEEAHKLLRVNVLFKTHSIECVNGIPFKGVSNN